jgi:hypothetical protein
MTAKTLLLSDVLGALDRTPNLGLIGEPEWTRLINRLSMLPDASGREAETVAQLRAALGKARTDIVTWAGMADFHPEDPLLAADLAAIDEVLERTGP